MSKADAVKYLEEKGDEYKLDCSKALKTAPSLFTARRLHRPLSRPTHSPHGHVKAAKIMAIAGAYWKGTRPKATHPCLRRDLHQEERPQGTPRTFGAGQSTRPPQAGQGTRFVPLLREGGAGASIVVAQRRRPPHALGKLPQRSPAQVRVRAGHHTPHWKQRIVRDLRPLRQIRGRQLPTHQHARRGRGVPPEAHELSSPLRDFQGTSSVLPGPRFAWRSLARSTVTSKVANSTA